MHCFIFFPTTSSKISLHIWFLRAVNTGGFINYMLEQRSWKKTNTVLLLLMLSLTFFTFFFLHQFFHVSCHFSPLCDASSQCIFVLDKSSANNEKTDDVQFPCQRCLQMHSVILQSCGTIDHRKIIYIFSKLEMILRL